MTGGAIVDGDRLKDRISAAGLTHAELAARVGAKQPTITRLITGEQRASKYLHQIAVELNTTSAYLVGATDDPHSEGDSPILSAEQREWLDLIDAMRARDRAAILHIARAMSRASD
jgi:transcriptional regulator with XRE-family HTH domain